MFSNHLRAAVRSGLVSSRRHLIPTSVKCKANIASSTITTLTSETNNKCTLGSKHNFGLNKRLRMIDALMSSSMSTSAPNETEKTSSNFDDVVQIYKPSIKEEWKNLPRLVVDVRNDDEVRQGMVHNALHIPITKLAGMSTEDIQAEFKDHLVMLYCKSGVRSQLGASLLSAHKIPAVNLGGYSKYADAKQSEGSKP